MHEFNVVILLASVQIDVQGFALVRWLPYKLEKQLAWKSISSW